MPTICLLLKYFATVLTKTQQIIAFPCHRPNEGLLWHWLALEMILNTWDNTVVDASAETGAVADDVLPPCKQIYHLHTITINK